MKIDFSQKALKGWRYKLFDSSYPIRPVWFAAFVLAVAGVFIYIIWPGLVYFVLAVVLLIEIYILVKKWFGQYKYYREYVNESQAEEKRVVETQLSEPPRRR